MTLTHPIESVTLDHLKPLKHLDHGKQTSEDRLYQDGDHLMNGSERDLLIELKVMVRELKEDVKALEVSVADKTGDHEKRIRSLESLVWKAGAFGAGAGAAAGFIVKLLVK